MERRDRVNNEQIVQRIDSRAARQDQPDPRQRILALALELSKRAAEIDSLDDLYFFFVNDLHVLLEFDRCFLITHFRGISRFAAANNQPLLESKSRLFAGVNELAPRLAQLKKGLFLSDKVDDLDSPSLEIGPELKAALRTYLRISGCRFCLCVPLPFQRVPIAHLMFEFMEDKPPEQLQLAAMLQLAPLFGSILAEKWLLAQKPEIVQLLGPASVARPTTHWLNRRSVFALAAGLAVLLAALLFYPIDYTVGGEAAIVPWDRHVAFCKMGGLIDKVVTQEGARVTKDEVLAKLDPTELEFKIESAKREAAILKKKMELLAFESDTDPSKLGERKILELERKKVINEFEYLKWQSQFLDIKAPAEGIVLTRDVETLAGKRVKEGEPFCEIAVPGLLAAEVLVPEDKVSLVNKGQPLHVYLNNNPLKGYRLSVDDPSPSAEVVPRLGNVCRVRAKFTDAPASIKVGMKGVGKIDSSATNLWTLIKEGLVSRWNRMSLYF
ncbi:MAG: efflux RND transporter periplasmic adaptor subunit [Thermodesulfobacteriota bacterium]